MQKGLRDEIQKNQIMFQEYSKTSRVGSSLMLLLSTQNSVELTVLICFDIETRFIDLAQKEGL